MNFERSPRNSFLPRNNKEHVGRIRWDYFQFGRRAPLTKWKFRIALIALFLVVLPTAAYFVAPRFVDGKSSPGTVHHVHSTWNMSCDACHVANRSVDAFTSGKWNEFKCQECHAGPVHHESAKLTAKQNCASCHRDHQGPDSAMTRSPDSDCTSCHASLEKTYKDEFKAVAAGRWADKITAFHVDHPEFKIVEATKAGTLDPEVHRSLKFSHAMHMNAGIGVMEGAGQKTLADLKDPKDRERYRWVTAQVLKVPMSEVKDTEKIALNCASCHALDSAEQQPALETVFPNPSGIRPEPLAGTDKPFDLTKSISNLPRQSILPPRQKGEYYLPTVFEQHCKVCHPLRFDPSLPDEVIPHRLTATETRTFLERFYARTYLKDSPLASLPTRRTTRLDPRLDFENLETPNAPEKEEGKKANGVVDKVDAKVGEAEKELATLTKKAERQVYTIGDGCIKCHNLTTDAKTGRIDNVKGGRAPVVWMEHSRFNHSSHHAMACIDCHAGAYEKLPATLEAIRKPLVEKGPLDLPGIQNCIQCHAPLGTDSLGAKTGGVRSNCTDCHTYHNGDHSLAGPGDPSRGPLGAKTWTISDLLRGSRKE